MGGKRKKKGESGEATKYITRTAAVRKLQLTLRDFRRLCILKGIYPREPKNRKKAQRGDTRIKTLYLLKDIQFLLHEPIIWTFREHRAFMHKIKKAKNRKEREKADSLWDKRPIYRLDHIVQERYPTFVDALRDLDDPLSLCVLFSKMPRHWRTQEGMLNMCRRLTVEFMHYCIEAHALRKVFISFKGYYYQVEVMGQTITWIAPHPFAPQNETDVDLRIMKVFVEFYIYLLGFVNFRLYHSLNIHYPPKLHGIETCEGNETESISELVASLNIPLVRNKVEDNEEEEDGIDTHLLEEDGSRLQEARAEEEKKKQQQSLFKGFKFFLNRETNLESLTFVIRACKGQVSWEKSTAEGSTYPETDESITHQIIDRPQKGQKYLSRYYIQPQWVYDCINARLLLPVQDYFPGVIPPAHLSPFENKKELYVPPEQERLMALQRGELPLEAPHKIDDSDEENEEIRKRKKVKKAKKKPAEDENEVTEGGMENEKASERKEEAPENEKASEGKEDGPENEKASEGKEEGQETGKVSERNEESKENEKAGEEQDRIKNGNTGEVRPKRGPKMAAKPGFIRQVKKAYIEQQQREEKRLAVMMIPRKHRGLYKRLYRDESRLNFRAKKLANKRRIIDEEKKEKEKKKKKKLAAEFE